MKKKKQVNDISSNRSNTELRSVRITNETLVFATSSRKKKTTKEKTEKQSRQNLC